MSLFKYFICLIFSLVLVSKAGDVFSQRKFYGKSKVKNLPNYDYKQLHFGFTLGFNQMNFSLQHSADFIARTVGGNYKIDEIFGIETTPHVGINLGPVSNLRLGRFFDLRFLIVLSFGQRDLLYKTIEDTLAAIPKYIIHKMQLESTFIEFPLSIKYKATRINNYRPYILAGINPKYDLAAKKKVKPEEMPKVRLDQFDTYYEIGFGIDFYLTYFKFSTEIKFGRGLRNILKNETGKYAQYTDAIDKLNSQIWMISFHFE